MKRSRKLMAATAALGLISAVGVAKADVVSQWDMSLTTQIPTQQEIANATGVPFGFDIFNYVEPGSLVDPNTGIAAVDGFMPSGFVKYSIGKTNIFTDASMTTQNGAMTWKERDTQGPGLSIVTGDDLRGENCIMSAGWMPESPWGTDIKQCSDPWQTSKRFKMVSYALDGPVDLTFDVTATGSTDVYRLLQKYGNHTGSRVTGYTQEVGFLVNGQFQKATPGSGIGFCAKSGAVYDDNAPTPSSVMNQGELDSLMAHGLFGAVDKHHLTTGYFNPYVRATFGLIAGETSIATTGLAAVHRDLFGEWLPGNQMKGGFFYDGDANPYTDNSLVANCEGSFDEEAGQAGAPNAGCDGQWVSYRQDYQLHDIDGDGLANEPAPSVGTDVRAPILVDDATIAAWMADPLWIPGDIDDLANVNINAFISVGNAQNWPTADGNGNASFTIRMTPTFDAAAAQTEPGLDDPAAFVVSMDAPNTVIP
ncbi:MAG: choice-of-anchor F family protein [Proteobacteria bacterium]|nr:choice-of-anchor F family protein [Pseudomonadota bacterium]MBU1639606.1 choice-of-anchor F family protein [Pseudomonadota bacterium]